MLDLHIGVPMFCLNPVDLLMYAVWARFIAHLKVDTKWVHILPMNRCVCVCVCVNLTSGGEKTLATPAYQSRLALTSRPLG